MKSLNSKTLMLNIILFVFVISLSAMPATAQAKTPDPKELASQCIEAMGGETGIQNFYNFKGKGLIKFSFGSRKFEGSAMFIQKGVKNYLKMSIAFGGNDYTMINAYDGKMAWNDQNGTVGDQPALEYETNAKHQLTVLLDKNAKLSLGGDTEVGDKKAHCLVVEVNGNKTTFLIDQNDHTLLESAWKDTYYNRNQVKEEILKQIRYCDYKKVDGMPFPHTMQFFSEGKNAQDLVFETLELNPNVPADMFQRPDEEIDFRYSDERLH